MKKASQSIHSTQSYLGDCCSWYFCTSELWFKLQSTELACIDSLSSCVFMTWQQASAVLEKLTSESCTPKPAGTIYQKQSKHQQPLANMYWDNAKCPRHSWPGKPRAINSKLLVSWFFKFKCFNKGRFDHAISFSYLPLLCLCLLSKCGKVHPKLHAKERKMKKGSSVAKWPTGLPKTVCYRRHYIDLPKEWLVSSILDVHPCIQLQFWLGSGTQTCCENIWHANLPICAATDNT